MKKKTVKEISLYVGVALAAGAVITAICLVKRKNKDGTFSECSEPWFI